MKKLLFFSLSILIVSFLESCKKDPLDDLAEDEARMYGRVLEKGSNKPVKGATVYLSSSKCQFLGGCIGEVIDSITTDDSGVYDFKYKYLEQFGGSFAVGIKVPEGFYPENSIVALAPNTNQVVKHDIVLLPFGWIKVHVKNINPFDEFDKVSVQGSWGGASHDNIYYNKDVNLYFKRLINGNDSVGIAWFVTKNNIYKSTVKKVYALAHDTTNFEILY